MAPASDTSPSWSVLGLTYRGDDPEQVFQQYLQCIADEGLRHYQEIIQTGSKQGESLWLHVLNGAAIIERLQPLFGLNATELRCLLLAMTLHDINKLPAYSKDSSGKAIRYANAATLEHLASELEALQADRFFPQWRDYLRDIKFLVDSHQDQAPQNSQFSFSFAQQCRLPRSRLEGPLRALLRTADVLDLSHSSDQTSHQERHIHQKALERLNEGLHLSGGQQRYRFISHRLAEQRGLLSNTIHNQVVHFLQEQYGPQSCIPLLFHAEGVDYLLNRAIPFTWTRKQQRELTRRVIGRLAEMQQEGLTEFIKARPSGINVDKAALDSGASIERIFGCITKVVMRKQYREDWRQEREAAAREDLQTFLASPQAAAKPLLQAQCQALLAEQHLLPVDSEAFKRGEFLMAYRNFLEAHRGEELKRLHDDAWQRAARLFGVPEERQDLYALVNSYRRGYVMARDLPAFELPEMEAAALADLARLEKQAQQAAPPRAGRGKREQRQPASSQSVESRDQQDPAGTAEGGDLSLASQEEALLDYLDRHLSFWDLVSGELQQPVDFQANLRHYADPRHANRQCSYCSSPLPAEEWMALQVPPSIGVQQFSNRLEGGSPREPKRNICPICRLQFLLEKLAWPSHRDKQGSEFQTFYLHLFPYSFFPGPLLQAWWQTIESVREEDLGAIDPDTRDAEQWQRLADGRFLQQLRYRVAGREGLVIPRYEEALSPTPVLPLTINQQGYGRQYLVALEKALLLAAWFDCRVLLSRLPTPLLNLEQETIGSEPVAFMAEGVPQALTWLLPEQVLTRPQVQALCRRLALLHKLILVLQPHAPSTVAVLYDLVAAAAHDPLMLYHEVDRLIEEKAGKERYVLKLSYQVAPLLEQLLGAAEAIG
ncbi:type I-D CRISPR-associated protein Cas10d/Csc3 [Thermogemmatispora tikiterensis]|uniref:Type I-D CRISPR-associated protein Cas10d/Csc3 n=1 Tax=Thermogemmatispora tikiterensis TaxID=1825093 RepID=A0A328VCQ2_9CHLR|nr:type I-D CRISPR-associated protein Cas10d/Csc3 [Thermogemmatispora tikiterensis]RAQ95516.1 type I-D CRISPR-associated protein Cas10d/Csc3 [Thermogemmatispora tikiterensis]